MIEGARSNYAERACSIERLCISFAFIIGVFFCSTLTQASEWTFPFHDEYDGVEAKQIA